MTTNIFTHLLSDLVIIETSEHTTEQLVKSGFAPINPHKFKNLLVHNDL